MLVAHLALVAVILLALEVPLAIIYSRHEHDALNSSLQRDTASLSALSEEVIEHPGDHDVAALARRYASNPRSGTVLLVDRAGHVLTPVTPGAEHAGLQAPARAALSGKTATGEFEDLLYIAVPIGPPGDVRGAVLIARSDAAIDQRVHRFWLLLAAIAVGLVILSLFVSSWLARWVAKPLRRLDRAAAALGHGDLASRADSTQGPPEVVTLAETFNEMADRLDELVTSQRRFAADASHQLRTPLTALRLRLENLDGTDAHQVAAARDAALKETTRLTRLVDGLLSLAKAEGHRPERQPVDVGAVLLERQQGWAPLGAEYGIDIVMLDGDHDRYLASLVPGHLEQILDNLIDNALDASSSGDTVSLRVISNGPNIDVHVTDQGRGMTDEQRQRAFQPFWQDATGTSGGSAGLGLAIAEQLARASNGSITLDRSDHGGIDAIVRFPHAFAQ